MAETRRHRVRPTGDTVFAPDEIDLLISDAFTASVNPRDGQPLSEERLAYCRNFATALVQRLDAQDVATGHMTYTEAVCMLLGSALAMQKLHGGSY